MRVSARFRPALGIKSRQRFVLKIQLIGKPLVSGRRDSGGDDSPLIVNAAQGKKKLTDGACDLCGESRISGNFRIARLAGNFLFWAAKAEGAPR